MRTHVVTTVEQFWHKVPGGTAHATKMTLGALDSLDEYKITGIAANHRRSTKKYWAALSEDSVKTDIEYVRDLQVLHSRLPRPLLYESWLRLNYPSVNRLVGSHDVFWASAMIVPPTSAHVVTTVNDLDFLDNPDRLSRRGKSFFPRVWDKAKKRSDVIVCPTNLVAKDCVSHGVADSKVKVIPWGVSEIDPITVDQKVAFDDLNLPDQYVLWVGTLEPRKNLSRLVEAMSEVPDVPLVVVGPKGWGSVGSDLAAKFSKKVIKLGSIDYDLLDIVYRNASVFAFPSLAEGFGLPILEAMIRGVPVVTSEGIATVEVADGAAFLVDPTDVESIRNGIIEVLSDSDLNKRFKKAGLRRAKKLSWANTASEYQKIFDS